jgi:hypothetical protein
MRRCAHVSFRDERRRPLAVGWNVRAAKRFRRSKPPPRLFGDALAAWPAVRPASLLAELPGAQCRLSSSAVGKLLTHQGDTGCTRSPWAASFGMDLFTWFAYKRAGSFGRGLSYGPRSHPSSAACYFIPDAPPPRLELGRDCSTNRRSAPAPRRRSGLAVPPHGRDGRRHRHDRRAWRGMPILQASSSGWFSVFHFMSTDDRCRAIFSVVTVL